MQTLSIGLPSTLGSYLKLCDTFFGKESNQSKFIQSQIDESPNGEKEVIQHESQMIILLANM